jgi:hypothetical protein
LGKELVVIEPAKNIKQLLTKVETNIIQMHWTEHSRHGEDSSVQNEMGELRSTENNIKPVESNKSQGEKTEKCKKSLRIRKTPIMKSNGFLRQNIPTNINQRPLVRMPLKIFFHNIRRLKNKHNELLCHLQELAPHVLLSY